MKKIIYIVLAAMLMGNVSCDDFLEPEQINLVYNEVFWKSEKDAEIALLGVYASYRSLMLDGQMYNRADATTGLIDHGHNGGSSKNLWTPGDFENPQSQYKSWGSLESFADWGTFYKVIASVNQVVYNLENMDENLFASGRKDQLMGEACFLRALVYFDIARIWGNAPLVLEVISSSDQVLNDDNTLVEKDRTSDVEILAQVLKDVDQACSLLQYDNLGSSTWGIRANKASAYALCGHANLWMDFLKRRDGQDAGEYVSNAIAALEKVEQGGYSLLDYASAEIADIYMGQSSEAVFEMEVSTANSETYRVDKNGIQNFTCKIVPLDGDVTKDRASNINWVRYSKKELIYPEYPTDVRANLFFDAWDSEYDERFSDVSQVASDRNKVTWMKKYALMSNDPSAEWDEYLAYFAEANIPVFRFSGIQLLLAEAYVKNEEEGKALFIVNQIRSRAGLAAYSGSDLLAEVLMQRRAELIGEGHIFFDSVRNNFFADLPAMSVQRYQEEGYYWPVSSNVLTTNKKVKQTPYWNGKTVW